MAETRVGVTKPPAAGAKGKGGGLAGKKIAGLPLPVVLGGVVLAIVVGLYLKSRAAASAATSSAAPPVADTGSTGGGSATGDTSGSTTDPFSQLEYDLEGLTAVLSSGSTFQGAPGPQGDTDATGDTGPAGPAGSTGGGTSTQPTVVPGTTTPLQAAEAQIAQHPGVTSVVTPGGAVLTGQDAKGAAISAANTGSMSTLQLLSQSIPQTDKNFAADAVARSAAVQATGTAAPYGGVTGTKKLASGATVTTYASGRQVEQAPGKNAYVIKK